VDPKEYCERTKEELLEIAPIFSAPSKNELEKFCKEIEITDRAFTALILSAAALGFDHAIGTWEWVPPHLEWTPEVTRKFQEASGVARLPILRKLTNVFTERRLLTTHLFFRLETLEWHLFFSDQRDRPKTGNQWKHGAHWHFVNQLVRPDLSMREIIELLCSEAPPKIRSPIHIRYRETIGKTDPLNTAD
jgi:hypothetical protein